MVWSSMWVHINKLWTTVRGSAIGVSMTPAKTTPYLSAHECVLFNIIFKQSGEQERATCVTTWLPLSHASSTSPCNQNNNRLHLHVFTHKIKAAKSTVFIFFSVHSLSAANVCVATKLKPFFCLLKWCGDCFLIYSIV